MEGKTLYQTLVDAGVEISNHESDLYFPVTKETTQILDQFPLQKGNATTFANQRPPNVGQRWYDVPFAYVPWWEHRMRQKGVTGCKTGSACNGRALGDEDCGR